MRSNSSATNENSHRDLIKRSLQLKRVLRIIWHSSRWLAVANISIVIAQGLMPLTILILLKLLLDAVDQQLSTSNEVIPYSELYSLIVAMAIIALIGRGLGMLNDYISKAQAHAVTEYMHDILHTKAVQVDFEYYEQPRYYDTFHRAQREAPYRPTSIVQDFTEALRNGVSLLAMGGLLLAFHWGIALLMLVSALPSVLLRMKYARQLFNWQRSRTARERMAFYYSSVLTDDQHAKEVRIFGLGDLFARYYRYLIHQLRREELSIFARRSVADFLAQIFVTVVLFGSLGFMIFRTISGMLTIGDLVMYYQGFQRGQEALLGCLRAIAKIYEDNLFLSSLFEFLDLTPKLSEPKKPKQFPNPIKQGIKIDNVSFHYPQSDNPALNSLSLAIPPRGMVAIVGANGSGKTSLIKLLLRLYDPIEGTITIDDIDLRDYRIADIRKNISILFQDFSRYHMTATENIQLGDISLPDSSLMIQHAAKQSTADEFVKKFKDGYSTLLGKWFEQGEELSGGQWQKIALARALVGSSPIMILDEPTSAMDAVAEAEISEFLHELARYHIVIVASHRLSTIKYADLIYVFKGGSIIESGTHSDLLIQRGEYARLFKSQANIIYEQNQQTSILN